MWGSRRSPARTNNRGRLGNRSVLKAVACAGGVITKSDGSLARRTCELIYVPVIALYMARDRVFGHVLPRRSNLAPWRDGL